MEINLRTSILTKTEYNDTGISFTIQSSGDRHRIGDIPDHRNLSSSGNKGRILYGPEMQLAFPAWRHRHTDSFSCYNRYGIHPLRSDVLFMFLVDSRGEGAAREGPKGLVSCQSPPYEKPFSGAKVISFCFWRVPGKNDGNPVEITNCKLHIYVCFSLLGIDWNFAVNHSVAELLHGRYTLFQ